MAVNVIFHNDFDDPEFYGPYQAIEPELGELYAVPLNSDTRFLLAKIVGLSVGPNGIIVTDSTVDVHGWKPYDRTTVYAHASIVAES